MGRRGGRVSNRVKIDPGTIAEVPYRRVRGRVADRNRYLIMVFDHGLEYPEPGYGHSWKEAWQRAGRPRNWAAYQIYPFAQLAMLPNGWHVSVASEDMPKYIEQHCIAWPIGRSASG
jgi:hypothetical protein